MNTTLQSFSCQCEPAPLDVISIAKKEDEYHASHTCHHNQNLFSKGLLAFILTSILLREKLVSDDLTFLKIDVYSVYVVCCIPKENIAP